MASWLIGAPGERGNSRLHRQFMKERVEAKPMLSAAALALAPATIEMIAAATTTTTPATKTKLNRSAIKSSSNTNERVSPNIVC